MTFRKLSVRYALLGYALTTLIACGRDVPTANEPALSGTSGARTLLTAADSAAAIAEASQTTMFTVATTTSIAITAGESIVVTVLSTDCSGNPETLKVYGAISGVVASAPCTSLSGTQVTLGPASQWHDLISRNTLVLWRRT